MAGSEATNLESEDNSLTIVLPLLEDSFNGFTVIFSRPVPGRLDLNPQI